MMNSHNNLHHQAVVAVVHRHHHLTQVVLQSLTLSLIPLRKRRENCDDVYSFVFWIIFIDC